MSPAFRHILDRLRNRTAAFVHDLLMIPVAWMAAYWVRFNLSEIPEPYWSTAIAVLPALVFVQGTVFWYLGLYRGVWRFASLPDLMRILRAVVIGLSLSAVAIFFVTRMADLPRSILPLYGLFLVAFLGAPRLAYRWLKDHRLYYPAGRKALIVGAGQAGEALARELLRDPELGYLPVGFVDDDKNKKGREIHGVRVMGGCEKLPRLAQRLDFDIAIVAMPSANAAQMRRIVDYCGEANVPARTLPAIQDLVSGRASIQSLREISIDDLLGRDPVALDWATINAAVAGRTVLVSGGGGSIGSELCRQIARLGPKRLVVLDASEHNLYRIDLELRTTQIQLAVEPVLADAGDRTALERVFSRYSPDLVFHAAAFKHVPMLERHAREAIRNNVLGTEAIAETAGRFKVRSFVLISTDKAVNPTNIMGSSKRLAEVVCQAMRARYAETAFITVRFGNVLDSAGSVVPLFREQIAQGGPVTVTHRDVTRFFMTIPEACQLILLAGATGQGGEVLVLDMGEPVNITYLAEQMIRLAGKTPGDDIAISYIGLRPGEKLYEELFLPEEERQPTAYGKLFLARGITVDAAKVNAAVEALRVACADYDEEELHELVPRLVSEMSRSSADAKSRVVAIAGGKQI
jgi:FlaA1/EpsC-like NDP-sugar epimerase